MRKLYPLVPALLLLSLLASACGAGGPSGLPAKPPASESLKIEALSDNRSEYPEGAVPVFEKFELTFKITGSTAANPYFPYDPDPPPGVDPGLASYNGISVDAFFSPDGWKTSYRVPAFYYQPFEENLSGEREWYYPTDGFAWKVRFAPDRPGEWQFSLQAVDASGGLEMEPLSFTVVEGDNPGFVGLSQSDPRYFETDSGEYYPVMGFNLSGDQLSALNPQRQTGEYLKRIGASGVSVVRVWMPALGIRGSSWNPWNSFEPYRGAEGYVPFTGLTAEDAYFPAGSETSMVVNAAYNPCMFLGWGQPTPAVKPGATYRVRVRYRTQSIEGPRQPGAPYGLVVKLGGEQNGGWLQGPGQNCQDAGTGIVISAYADRDTIDSAGPWQVIEGSWTAGEQQRFLPYFYLAMENLDKGRALIDMVWVEEDLGGGQYGPNILHRPWMSHHLYIDQRNAYAFDKVLAAAEGTGVRLQLVTLEKLGWVFNRITAEGSFDQDSPGNDNFYGAGRQVTKVRWLQQAWWRYIQARWGYSTAVFSWELLNEGDPASTAHFLMADEFGKYMHCRVFGVPVKAADGQRCELEHPNAHPVTTSFWHSFPVEAFWTNPAYPNLDYIDIHAYVSTGWLGEAAFALDGAAYHLSYSTVTRRALERLNEGKTAMPVVRGEAGLDSIDQSLEQPDLAKDNTGVWLHNLLWATLDPGGMKELYWWSLNIDRQPGPDGQPGLYEIYRYFADFKHDIPLNNGRYVDAQPQVSNPGLRAVGQKDVEANRAHLWVQNTRHTWRNVVDGASSTSGIGGTLRLEGFTPGAELPVEWWLFTSQGTPEVRVATISVGVDGSLVLELPSAPSITDAGVKIGAP